MIAAATPLVLLVRARILGLVHNPMQDQQPGHDTPYRGSPPPGGAPVYGMAPIVEEEEGWGKIGIAMVTLALIFAGGVAYFIATSGDDELQVASAQSPSVVEPGASVAASDAGPTPPTAAPVEPVEPVEPTAADETRQALLAGASGDAGPAVESPASVNTEDQPLRANGELDRPAGLVSLSLESEPPGADVIRKQDGVRLGKTPYLYETEAMPGSVHFVLQLEGYKSMSLSLPSDRDGVRQIMLLPGKGGAPIPAPSAEPEKPAPVKNVPAKAEPKPAVKPGSSPVSKVKARARPKARTTSEKTEVKKTRKPKGGRVDYNADAIPLD